ncbi:MAG: triphosphoribosyl-dephospho-CoA synthase CitG [Clostridia bacterium]|nr:triphosphoribosyl-dephospho-CoA synthase CitG [Clostridia bacterium]
MTEVTLEKMLRAREDRVLRQKEHLLEYKCPLICFTMNIAGPIKNSPLIERAFYVGVSILKNLLPQKKIKCCKILTCDTGCEMLVSLDESPRVLKDICVKIEESSPIGRLFDMDVICQNGEKLTRKNERSCIVCGAPGRGCSARRLHSAFELQAVTHSIMTEFFREADGEKISALAAESLIKEARTTPKPGLVDLRNNGSHTDMNIDTFIKSANSLRGYFKECFLIGTNTSEKAGDEVFAFLRPIGIEAEKAMYQATNGVNTHKGAIYSMGLLCASVGRLWKPDFPVAQTDKILIQCGEMVKSTVKSDFEKMKGITAVERLYLEKGIKGIRGEASSGFESVRKFGLPAYEKALGSGLSENDAGVVTLLNFIANIKDTNLYRRGGSEGSFYAAEYAKRLLESSHYVSTKEVEKMDDCFILRNLSPGGCADLLAVTYFLYDLNNNTF